MKIPIVKEWGSWAVFFLSVLAALAAGLLTRPWERERDFSGVTALTIAGLAFLVNSKNPLASVLKRKPAAAHALRENKKHLSWFLLFSLSGLAMLIPFLIDGVEVFSVFLVLVLSYGLLLFRGKEHNLFTELNGFALLTLSAPVVYFTVTGELSLKLYAAVLLFFAAGVFKVRVRIRKTSMYRWIMVLYCILTFVVYVALNISVIILLPLIENITSVLLMREEKLRTTGNTELIKGIIFVILVGLFWS